MLCINDAVADTRYIQQLRAEHDDSDKICRGMQQKLWQKRKVAKQGIGQLQGWLEHDYSSQAGNEALNADADLRGEQLSHRGASGTLPEKTSGDP